MGWDTVPVRDSEDGPQASGVPVRQKNKACTRQAL